MQTLTPDSPLWSWATDEIHERAETMLQHLEGVRVGEDIEAVHDMRVWSRRLVAAMRVFAACFPGDDYRRLFREARQVTGALGEVRDLDVILDYYERLRSAATDAEHLGIDYIQALLRRNRDRARKPMLAALSRTAKTNYSGRVRRFLEFESGAYQVGLNPQVVAGIRGAGKCDGECLDCEGSFRSAAPGLLETRLDELLHFEPYVADPVAETELHAMRIAAKWLRYTMELLAPAYKDRLKDHLASVKRIQELLGDLHDSDVRRWLIRDHLARPLRARGLEALGLWLPEPVQASLKLLANREEDVRKGCYNAFYKEWKKLERRRFSERLRRRIAAANG